MKEKAYFLFTCNGPDTPKQNPNLLQMNLDLTQWKQWTFISVIFIVPAVSVHEDSF